MDFRKMPLAAAVLAVGLGVSCPLFAQVYKWTDDHGHVHFSDHAPGQQKATTLDLPESADPAPAPDLTEEQHKLRQKKLVKADQVPGRRAILWTAVTPRAATLR